MILLIIPAVWLALAYIPARIAASKGRSFVGFYFAGLFCFFPAFIVAMAMSRPSVREGDIVTLSRRVELEGGAVIPAGYAAKALDVDVIDGEPVVLIKGPSGARHWVAMAAAGGSPRGGGMPYVVPAILGGIVLVGILFVAGTLLITPMGFLLAGAAATALGLHFTGRELPVALKNGVVVGLIAYAPSFIVVAYFSGLGSPLLAVPLALGVAAVVFPRMDPEAPPVLGGDLLGRLRPSATPDAEMDGFRSPVVVDRSPVPMASAPGQMASWFDDEEETRASRFVLPRPVRFELATIDGRSADRRGVSPGLGVSYDTSSWFPMLDAVEATRAGLVLSIVVLDGSPEPQGFALRGKSTMLVTSHRLVGVCPQGETVGGPFRAETGSVGVWSMALDEIGSVTVTRSAATEHAIVRSRREQTPWLLLAKPRVVKDGALQTVPLHDVVELVNAVVSQQGG
jgi:hypothetical protein